MNTQQLINRLEKIINEIETDRYTMESLMQLVRELRGRA